MLDMDEKAPRRIHQQYIDQAFPTKYALGTREEVLDLLLSLKANNRYLTKTMLGCVMTDAESMETCTELLETNAMLIGMIKMAFDDFLSTLN